ncbi:hypothetical protein QIS99_31265 [Streptomyces sp. B-S-A8]|uniref:Uncharacterized protein n=1 Tax=Streptomyces solicavernae TaxID=3043614 RepID=A0ABT6S1T5_9ACTN|nr:hypothetical protein [Streptomyces sp. B-S-A8]MDI3390642.1 hypothetical protein [Streptomyces sp. B-S-A8]
MDQDQAEFGDYAPEDLRRLPLLTLQEAHDILGVLRRAAAGSGAEAAEARRYAHVLAYRLPAADPAPADAHPE